MWEPGQSATKIDLSGRSKAHNALSRHEILANAKKEREKRRRAKAEPKAVTSIAAAWRGYTTRAAIKAQFAKEWLVQYGHLVSQTDSVITGAELATRLLPLSLFILLPPPFSPLRPSLESGSLSIVVMNDCNQRKQCLRGTMAVLLRNLSSKSGDLFREASPSLLQRTALLCCSSISSPPSSTVTSVDALTQTAAARVLVLLIDEAHRLTAGAASPTPLLLDAVMDGSSKANKFVQWCVDRLQALPEALRRWCTSTSASGDGDSRGTRPQRNSNDNNDGERGGSILRHQEHHHQQISMNLLMAQFKIIDAVDILLQAGVLRSNSNTTPSPGTKNNKALERVVERVMTVPGAAPTLFPSASDGTRASTMCRVRTSSTTNKAMHVYWKRYFPRICTHVVSLAVQGRGEGSLLTTLTACFLSIYDDVNDNDKDAAEEIKASYARAIEAICPLLHKHQEMEDVAVGVFADGLHAKKLSSALSIPQFSLLYYSLIFSLQPQQLPQPPSSSTSSSTLRLLSAVSFSSLFIPRTWPHLAHTIGLPLDIPPSATQFSLPSLFAGIAAIPPPSLPTCALFCRCLDHYLSAADDVEIYEEQGVLSLGQVRAMASSFTTLFFYSHINGWAGGSSAAPKEAVEAASSMLLQYMPLVLRALFDRDVRRQFCASALWLAPYKHYIEQAGGKSTNVDVSGASVLRALIQRAGGNRGDGGDDGDDNDRGNVAENQRITATTTSIDKTPANALASILLDAPQCIPFTSRLEVFRGLIMMDKQARRYHLSPAEGGPRPLRVVIRRQRLVEDAVAGLLPHGGALRGPLSISFLNEHGMEEAGIDMGGLTKELLDQTIIALLNQDRGLFTTTGEYYYPHPLAMTMNENGLALFTLAGMVVGKALYESILLPAPLAPFFIAKLQSLRSLCLDDLAALDADVYKSLAAIKRYMYQGGEGGHECDCSALGLDFTIETDVFGAKVVTELVAGGAGVAVTNANVLQYVHLVADWHLRRRLDGAATAFKRGLAQIFPLAWLRLFSARELNQLLGGGGGGGVDVEDLRRHARYSGGYSATSGPVCRFWNVLRKMNAEDKAALLRFVTSSSRAPLGGFAHLEPPFTIHRVVLDSGDSRSSGGGSGLRRLLRGLGTSSAAASKQRLPSSSTCANTLKLPEYKNESTLKEKLLYAIHSGAGFDLS